MRKYLPLIFLILAALACSLPFELFNPPPLVTPQPPVGATATPMLATPIPSLPPATATVIPPLTLAQIASMDVYAPVYARTVTLTDGQYQSGSDPASPDYLAVVLLNSYAQGDLNADGASDIAVLLVENGGGTGSFVSLIIFLNQGGQPVQTAAVSIDDRPLVNSLTFADGQVIFDGVIHGFEDPGCCPSFAVTQTYRLFGERLTLTRLTSRTPTGAERAITIESPRNGESVSGAVRLTGRVTIAPFENNLVCRIYDAFTGAELSAMPCMVSAPDMGAPGTFDVEIPLAVSPSGGLIRIELQDESMADGSLLAMDSVTLRLP